MTINVITAGMPSETSVPDVADSGKIRLGGTARLPTRLV